MEQWNAAGPMMVPWANGFDAMEGEMSKTHVYMTDEQFAVFNAERREADERLRIMQAAHFAEVIAVTQKQVDAVTNPKPPIPLRDWFAGQALAGIMANPERWRDIARRYDQGKMTYDDASKSNAVKAYSIADAMLAAREGGK